MTGPGYGKLRVDDAIIRLYTPAGTHEIDADVYIHVRGYSRARVTHLDIEHGDLNRLLPNCVKGFFPARGTGRGFVIDFSRFIKGFQLELESKLLSNLIPFSRSTWVYVGSKSGGIFIGFRKEFIEKLEYIAINVYGLAPRRRRS